MDTARKRKQKRLKQAKDEAQAEVEAYRSERETTYKEREDAHMGSRGDLEAKINGQTQFKLQEVDAAFQSESYLIYDWDRVNRLTECNICL